MDFHEKARNAMRSASPEGKEEKRRRILLSAADLFPQRASPVSAARFRNSFL